MTLVPSVPCQRHPCVISSYLLLGFSVGWMLSGCCCSAVTVLSCMFKLLSRHLPQLQPVKLETKPSRRRVTWLDSQLPASVPTDARCQNAKLSWPSRARFCRCMQADDSWCTRLLRHVQVVKAQNLAISCTTLLVCASSQNVKCQWLICQTLPKHASCQNANELSSAKDLSPMQQESWSRHISSKSNTQAKNKRGSYCDWNLELLYHQMNRSQVLHTS